MMTHGLKRFMQKSQQKPWQAGKTTIAGQRLPWRERFRQQKGVAALEFALVAPLFFLVLFMSFELGFMMMADAALDRTSNRIARMGRIGLPSADCVSVIRNTMKDDLVPWARDDNFYIDVKVYEPDIVFSDIDDPNYLPSCEVGGPGALMVYRLGFDSPGFVGVLGALGLSPFHYERTVVIQNEP